MIQSGRGPAKAGPINVALYVRVSTDKQAKLEDGSLDTQLDRLNDFIEFRRKSGENWAVTEKLIEGEKDGRRHGRSAKDMDRPALQRLLELARARLIDIVVVTKLDRISRSVQNFLHLVAELEELGVKLISLREQIDLTSPAGRFQTLVLIALAEYERDLTSTRVKEKVAWRAEKGLPLGPPAIGFVMKDKIYAINEAYAPHVRAVDALYLENHSADTVVREFRQRGYRTPGGCYYTKPMICRMLRNPVYAAKIAYNGKLHDAQWKPIRSWDTHEQIQRIMDANARRKHSDRRQPRGYVYLIQGLLRCGPCGSKMSPVPTVGRNGSTYHYYACGKADKTAGQECLKKHVPAEALDTAVMEFLKQLNVTPERVRAIAAKENKSSADTIARLTQDLERIREQSGSVKRKLSQLTDVLAQEGASALASIRSKLEALEAEGAELETSELRVKRELAAERTQTIAVDDQVQTLALFDDLMRRNKSQPERLKALLPRFVDYVLWNPEENGEGKIEVALFPHPVGLAPDVTVPVGPDGVLFRPGVSVGVPDGI